MNQSPQEFPGEPGDIHSDDQPAMPPRRGPIGAPRLSRAHHSRQRLLQFLDSDQNAALRVIQAPAGYGKTSLLAEWVRARSHASDTVWVTVDDACNTRIGFWAYLIGLLNSTDVARGSGFDQVNVTADIASVLPATLLHGFESLPRPLTLIVDSYENIADPAIETDLLRLVRHTSSLHLVIGTRAPTALNSTSTALSVDAVVLDARALAFTADEAQQLAAHLDGPLTTEQVAALHHASDGWPLALRAGLQTPAEDPWPAGDEADNISRVQRMLIDDLSDTPGFDDLCVLSVVDAFTIGQAELLGALVMDHPILDEVESRGLGGWEEGASPARFRLQPLVREALRNQLNDERLRQAHRRLASWYEEHHDYARAFESAMAAQEWLQARKCLTTALNEVARGLDPNWMQRVDVPRHILRSQPLLALFVGSAHYRLGNVAKAVRILTAGIAHAERKHLTDHRHVTVDQLFVQATLMLGLRFAGRDELVQPALRRFRKMLPQVSDPQGELTNLGPVIATQMATTYIQLDRNDDAAQVLIDRPPANVVAGKHSFYPQSLQVLIHATAGRILQARSVLAELVDPALPRFFNAGFYAVPKHIGAAYIHLEDHRPEAAEAELVQVEPHWPTIEMWALFLHARTMQHWHSTGPASALRVLEAGLADKKRAPLGAAMNAMLTALRAELFLATNRLPEARQLIPSRRTRSYPRLAVAKARSLLLEGDYGRALALAAAPAHEHRATPRDELHMHLISASASLRSGHQESAVRSFTHAVDLAVRTGQRSAFAAMPRQDLASLAAAVPQYAGLHDEIEAFSLRFPHPEELISLTNGELRVLKELATQATLAIIAGRLSVAPGTIKSQCRTIYRKLGVSGRDEAVSAARRRRII